MKWGLRTMLTVVAAGAFALAGCKKGPQEESRRIEANELQQALPEVLVRANVSKVTEARRGWLESLLEIEPVVDRETLVRDLEIEHVYIGPRELRGRDFTVGSNKSGEGSVGMAIYPPLENGEVGIWSLYKKDNELLVYPWGLADMEIELPARKGISETYEDVRALAEAMEAVVAADSDKRFGLLKTYSGSQMPKVSMWAVRVLGELRNGQAKE